MRGVCFLVQNFLLVVLIRCFITPSKQIVKNMYSTKRACWSSSIKETVESTEVMYISREQKHLPTQTHSIADARRCATRMRICMSYTRVQQIHCYKYRRIPDHKSHKDIHQYFPHPLSLSRKTRAILLSLTRKTLSQALLLHSYISLLQSNSSIVALSSIHGISNSRSLTFKHEGIVHGSTSNATKDGHKRRNQEVETLCGEDFTAVDDG